MEILFREPLFTVARASGDEIAVALSGQEEIKIVIGVHEGTLQVENGPGTEFQVSDQPDSAEIIRIHVRKKAAP